MVFYYDPPPRPVDPFGVVGNVPNIACYMLRTYLEQNLIRQMLKPYRFDKVLEVGCGYGRMMVVLKEFANEVYGVERNKEILGVAKKAFQGLEGFHFINTNANKLPFEDDTFDLTFTFTALQHNERQNVKPILDEIERVTKSYVLITEDAGLDSIVLNRGWELIDERERFRGNTLTHSRPRDMARLFKI